jgi:hypothetical protein
MRLLRSFLIASPIVAISILTQGCLSSGSDNQLDDRVLVNWEATDIQTLAADLVAGLIDSPELSYLSDARKGDDQRFVMYIVELENDAGVHVATGPLAQAMQTALIQSGKFRFVTLPEEDDAPRVSRPDEGEPLDDKGVQTLASELGVEIVLLGAVERSKSVNRNHAASHSLVQLEAYQLSDGASIWSLSRELRRAGHSELFGN